MTALIPEPDEIADYLADHYGQCQRGADCYHGKDAAAQDNGCLKVGWRGRACPYWKPTTARNWTELKAAQEAAR